MIYICNVISSEVQIEQFWSLTLQHFVYSSLIYFVSLVLLVLTWIYVPQTQTLYLWILL